MGLTKPLDPHAEVERAVAVDLVTNDGMDETEARALAHVLAPGLQLRNGEIDVRDDAAVLVARRAPGLARRIYARTSPTPDGSSATQQEANITKRMGLLGLQNRGPGVQPGGVDPTGVHRPDLVQRVNAGEDLDAVLADAGDDTEARISVRTAHAVRNAKSLGGL